MRSWIASLLFAGITLSAHAQSTPTAAGSDGTAAAAVSEDGARGVSLKSFPRNILQDQQALFTMPFRMNQRQWAAAVPLSMLTVGLVASDTAFEAHVTTNPSTVSHATTFSNAGLAGLVGVGGGMYVWGALAKNEHQRETGFLSGEAAVDAYLDTTLIKYIAGRERPYHGQWAGQFLQWR